MQRRSPAAQRLPSSDVHRRMRAKTKIVFALHLHTPGYSATLCIRQAASVCFRLDLDMAVRAEVSEFPRRLAACALGSCSGVALVTLSRFSSDLQMFKRHNGIKLVHLLDGPVHREREALHKCSQQGYSRASRFV